MSTPRHRLMTFVAVAVIALAMMPFVLSGDNPELDERRREIAEMTHAERERLHRNLDQYLQLTELEREAFRQIHTELENDAVNNHGRANESLNVYREWLHSLSPRERIELSEESDPSGKVRLVRAMIDRHRDEALETRAGASLRRLGPIPSLTPEDMERVLTTIAEVTELEILNSDLEGYEGLSRSLKVFELLGRRNEKLVTRLNDEVMQSVLSGLANDADRRMLEYLADDRPAPPQASRVKLAITLLKNLEVAVQRELRRRKVTPQSLQATFDQMPESEQDDLLELSADQFRAELRRQYIGSTSPDRINRKYVEQFLRPGRENRPRRRDGAAAKARRTSSNE